MLLYITALSAAALIGTTYGWCRAAWRETHPNDYMWYPMRGYFERRRTPRGES